MTNGSRIITGNQIESVANGTKAYVLTELLTLTNAVADEIDSVLPATVAGDGNKFLRGDGTWSTPTVIIGTTPSTLEGAFWLED